MSQTIDKRIVEMAFENQQFEKGVDTSLHSIDKLKKGLNFDGVGKGFASISNAAKNVNLGSIAQGVDHIASRFSAMSVVGITALVNLTNAAIQAGTRIVKALTIDPVSMGFSEYELKMNSVQTIMAGTGEDLQTVTKYLEELNAYADKTIYSFSNMTQNIGKFTNAGVSLEQSVNAIKGVANVAAVSGANAEEASRAMYNFAQALSSGYVKLIDWKSIELANMGTVEFKNQLLDAAVAAGTLTKEVDGTFKTLKGNTLTATRGFNEALTDEWMTTEVLVNTLNKYSDATTEIGKKATAAAQDVKTFTQLFDTLKEAAQSGWAQTWELIVGDFDEAKKFLTELNNFMSAIIGGMADARNNLLKGWKDLGGRTKMLEALFNVLNALRAIAKPIGEAFREIFPPITAKRLFEITSSVAEFTKALILSGEGMDKVKRIFKGIFAIFDIVRMAISALVTEIFGLSTGLSKPINSIVEFIATIADYIVGLRDAIKTSKTFSVVLGTIGDVIKTAFVKIGELAAKVKDIFANFTDGLSGFKGIKLDGLNSFIDKLKVRFEPLNRIFEITGKFVKLIGALIAKLAPVVTALATTVADGISGFLDKITASLENYEPERIFDIINGGLLGGILLAIRNFINKGSGIFGGITDILDGVKGSLEAWQQSLKAETLLKIAAALGIMALSLIGISMIDPKRLTNALGAMTAMFIQLGLSLVGFQKVTAMVNPLQMGTMALGLLAVAGAMLIMAGAVRMLATLSGEQLVKGMLAITALIGVIKIAAGTLAKSSGHMVAGSAALIVFSFAIRSLTKAVEKLGSIDTGELTQGLIGVGVIMTELAIFMRTTNLSGMGMIKSVGIFILAASVNALAFAVAKMGELDAAAITQGLIAMGVIFAELGAFVSLTGGGATLILTAAGVAVISASMYILAGVMEKFGNMSWEAVAKGLLAMGGALLLIGAAAYLIPPTLILQAAGLVVMAGALVILAKALDKMGSMSWEEIGRGLLALGGSLLLLSFALMAMSGSMMGSLALLVAAGALMAIAPALKILGSMSLKEIGLGLLALAGVFTVLGVAGALLTPVIPSLLGLGVAMALIGVAALAAGAGILMLSAGLAALAVSGAAGAAALVVVLTSIVGLIPMLVKTLGRAILALIDVLVAGAPTLLKGIVTFLNILIDGLIEILPKIVDLIINLVDQILISLAEKMPEMVEAGYSIIVSLLNGLKANIGEIVKIAYDIAINFINAIREKLPEIAQSGWDLIISWVDAMTLGVKENLPRLMDSVRELGIAIVKGLVEGIVASNEDARRAITEIGQIIIDGFKSTLGIHSPSAVFMDLARMIVEGLIRGLADNAAKAVQQMIKLGRDLIDSLKQKMADAVNVGRDFVTGFARGISQYAGTAIAEAVKLATAALNAIRNTLGSHSPAKMTIDEGKNFDDGMALGIKKFAGNVEGSAEDLGKKSLSALSSVMGNVGDAVSGEMNISPVITPVVNMDDVTAGAKEINNVLGKQNFTIGTSYAKASAISNDMLTRTTVGGEDPGTATNTVFEFTQNNYSPKALSRMEIYRQTRNQMMQLRGVLNP